MHNRHTDKREGEICQLRDTCPISPELALLEQRTQLDSAETNKEIKRVTLTVYGDGNGTAGLSKRVDKLEFQIQEFLKDLDEIHTKVKELAMQQDHWKWTVAKALFWLAAGGTGAAGLLKILGM